MKTPSLTALLLFALLVACSKSPPDYWRGDGHKDAVRDLAQRRGAPILLQDGDSLLILGVHDSKGAINAAFNIDSITLRNLTDSAQRHSVLAYVTAYNTVLFKALVLNAAGPRRP